MKKQLSHKERFVRALKRQPIEGHVPHFELVFFLTAEKIGKLHPAQRIYSQWDQMSAEEQVWHIKDVAQTHVQIAEIYQHDAIFIHSPFSKFDATLRLVEEIKKLGNDQFFLILPSDPTFAVPDGDNMISFSVDMYENGGKLHDSSKKRTEKCAEQAEQLKREGLGDGFAMCADYCFNTNPFFSPEQFDEFIVPYLKETITQFHKLGFYAIKHTDGNIMPILSQMVDCGPDAIHSLDPQGGVLLSEVKKLYGDKVALIGNVNCGLLQTGSKADCEADIRRSLREGMDGWGYIFSTSNCVYTGLPLERYEMMHQIWREEGIYA